MVYAVALLFLQSLQAQQSFMSERLSKKWETPAQFKVPESVCYDPARNVIYVSNISGTAGEKDGNGFISKVSPEGQIISLEWVTGLNSPLGMGISGDFLYVSDIDRVVKIDIVKGKVTGETAIPGATLLNDVATGKDGTIYVSDSRGNALYKIANGKQELLVKSDKLNGPNGLYVDGNRLLAGLKDRMISIDLKTHEISDNISNTGGIDGIAPDGNGSYLISDWGGNVHLVNAGQPKVRLLDTTPQKINAADIDYVISKKLLLVPTFNDNRVMAYELK